ncbi:MAG: acetyl/propionyl/methylcrotonyl-CoA carboxylase subunit alpha [Gammaproteobacteria bacterium]|nr:acetyl/propionyl/methylcrotonyl-CoA carboxylase subunit alpha [Gammaproteobacteria bacterium]
MFEKILIANRGEIACRIMNTAQHIGIRSVAVYSEADKQARHVSLADEAIHIGPAPASESYLDINKIIDAAKRTGAEAIHPGYGFLSENTGFAQACDANSICFIGPPASAIHAMGSKIEAKCIVQEAGVPVVPGYHGDDQDVATLQQEAKQIGFPLLIKASAGGGGKGMRVVESIEKFEEALQSAQREAKSSFGNDQVLLEKYLTCPRHIEVQVFADTRGNVVHLFERDCSIQRRHQKIIEQSPAPNVGDEQRQKMYDAAIFATRAIDYVGAGTIEFIVQDDEFYFMEMNTRLQVEHPVTEMICGQDLVEWQLRVANGEALPCSQDELTSTGHAIEVRLYAEDTKNNFLPVTGTLTHLKFPPTSKNTRIDSGVVTGDSIGIHYDPMIAKLIVWGDDRYHAIGNLRSALNKTQVAGLVTNLEYLKSIASHPEFEKGNVTTRFVEIHDADLTKEQQSTPDFALALACLHALLSEAEYAKHLAKRSNDPTSPWHHTDGWRLNEDNFHVLHFRDNDRELDVVTHYRKHGFEIELPGGSVGAAATTNNEGELIATIDGQTVHAHVVQSEHQYSIFYSGEHYEIEAYDPSHPDDNIEKTDGSLRSPMPGKIIEVSTNKGNQVSQGDKLLILEAMKMEHTITAPMDGNVQEIKFKAGDIVEEGVELILIESGEPAND